MLNAAQKEMQSEKLGMLSSCLKSARLAPELIYCQRSCPFVWMWSAFARLLVNNCARFKASNKKTVPVLVNSLIREISLPRLHPCPCFVGNATFALYDGLSSHDARSNGAFPASKQAIAHRCWYRSAPLPNTNAINANAEAQLYSSSRLVLYFIRFISFNQSSDRSE